MPRSGRRSLVQSDNSASEATPILLNSMQGIPGLQHEEEESSLLRLKVEELNKNIVLLIVEAGKLIQGAKQLSDELNLQRPQHEADGGYHPMWVVPLRDYTGGLVASIVAKSRFVNNQMVLVRREQALVHSGRKTRPGTGSLHPVAIGAAVEATKPPEPPV